MSTPHGVGRGKLILLGEHAVVHGQPAIACGLQSGVRVALTERSPAQAPPPGSALRAALEAAARAAGHAGDLEELGVSVSGDLPVAVGLGSSAALAVALVRALLAREGRPAGDDEVARMANDVERVFHGTPSGIDATTSAHGGWIWFEAGPPPGWETIRASTPVPLIVVLSGTRHDTGHTVGGLRRRAEDSPDVYRPVFRAVGDLSRAGRDALERGAWPHLGEIMSMNHELLRACGVSTPELDRAVDDARAEGALGAKLTGAGGGGAAIALAAGDPAELAGRLRARGWETFAV